MKQLLILLFLLCGSHLTAQSLDEYRLAVAHYSCQLKIAEAQTLAAAETAAAARTGYLPSLSAAGDFNLAARHREGVERWDFAIVPQFVQTLYAGGGVRATVRQTELAGEVALAEEEFAMFEVRYAADYAYWNLSATTLHRAAMREYVAIIRSLGEVVKRRFAEGLIARSDVLMIETRLNEAEYDAVETEQRYEVALHNFNILRGTPAMLEVRLQQTISDSLTMPHRTALDEALARRSDRQAAQLRIAGSGQAVRAVRAAFNPQVSIGIGGSWQPRSPNRDGSTQLDGVAFMRLSVPIFHGGERRRKVAAARAEQLRAEWQAAQLDDEIAREEVNGWTALVQSRAQVDASERSLRIATENLAISTYSYGEGAATILDVLQAQLSWIQLYTNSIEAHFNYALAIAAYQRITAQP